MVDMIKAAGGDVRVIFVYFVFYNNSFLLDGVYTIIDIM